MTKDKDQTPDDKVISIHSVKPPVATDELECDHECADCPERDECEEVQQTGCGDPLCPECQSRRVQQILEIAQTIQAIREVVSGDPLDGTCKPLCTAATRLAKAAQWISTQVYTGDQED
jgi:hypothetical protein